MGLYQVELSDGVQFEVSLSPSGHVWNAEVGDRRLQLRLLGACRHEGLLVEIDGRRMCLSFDELSDGAFQKQLRRVAVSLPKKPKAAPAVQQPIRTVESPIAGIILSVMATPGQPVKRGEPLFVVEAMKMENVVTAPQDGVFEQLQCKVGDVICKGQSMATVKAAVSAPEAARQSPEPLARERRTTRSNRPVSSWMTMQATPA